MKTITDKDIESAVKQTLNEAFGVPLFVESFVDFIIEYSKYAIMEIKQNYQELYNRIVKNSGNGKYMEPIGEVPKSMIQNICPEFAELFPFEFLRIWAKGGREEGAAYKNNLLLSCKNLLGVPGPSLKETLAHEFTHIINLRDSEGTGMNPQLNSTNKAIGLAEMTCYLYQDTEMNARISGFWWELQQEAMPYQEFKQLNPNGSPMSYINALIQGSNTIHFAEMGIIKRAVTNKSKFEQRLSPGCFSFDTFREEVNNSKKRFKLAVNYYWRVYKKVAKTRSNDVFRLPSFSAFLNMWAKDLQMAYNNIVRLIDSQIERKYMNFKKRIYRVAYEYYSRQTDSPELSAEELLKKILGE